MIKRRRETPKETHSKEEVSKVIKRVKIRSQMREKKEGLTKVSLTLGHVPVQGGWGAFGEKIMCKTHINQSTLNETCVNMLSVGVCESVSVHTVTLLA